MKSLLLFIAIFLVFEKSSADKPRRRELASEKPIVLQVGEDITIPVRGPLRLEESQNIKVIPQGSSVQILGLKPGLASFVSDNQLREIHVLSKTQMASIKVLRQYSEKRLGLRVDVRKAQVVLHGRLLRAEDWLDIGKVCAQCAYQVELQMSDEVKNQTEEKLRELLHKKGLPPPALRWNPNAFWILRSGKPPSALNAVAQSLGIRLQTEELSVDLAPLIRTQIFVLEARRERTRQWGVQWPSSVSAQLLPKIKDPFSAISMSAMALENQGEAKVLASPTLLCRSGEQAEFLAGGEFPIKVINLRMQDVTWKKYGILLKVKPTADRFGRMNISLETEISSIDPARTVDGVPALFTNRVVSHFDLAESKTIAISGLIKSEDSQSMQGLPGAQQIPVLGALFGSRDFRENRTELLILVRPSVIDHDVAEKEVL